MKNADMKIIIVGSGSIGTAIAKELTKDGLEVTIVDKDSEVIGNIVNTVDVIGYKGNGASYKTLNELNAKDADILIAITNSDELNLLSCFTAHTMGTKHTIARVRDVDYASQHEFYKDELGLSMVINPDLETANEIFRTLRFPLATRVELFAGGKAELIEMNVDSSSPLVNRNLIEIRKELDIDFLICAVKRDGEVFVPKGDTVILEEDVLYLTGDSMNIRKSFAKLKLNTKPLKSVMIAGNDRVSFYLADLLTRHGVNVNIVDENRTWCKEMASNLPKASVMNEDALRYFDVMSASDIQNTDGFVAITDDDEYNLIASMYAESQGISKVVSRISAKSRMKVLQKDSRISMVSREDVAADRIIGYTRALLNANETTRVEALYRLLDGQLEFVEFAVKNNDKCINVPLKEIKFKKNILLAGIIRDSRMIIPHGADVIKPGDSAIFASINQRISDLEDVYE